MTARKEPHHARSRSKDPAAIDALFDHPPEDEEALRRALAGLDPDAARRRLVERLREPGIERGEAAFAGAALRVLEPGGAHADLVAILGDTALPDHARLAAVTAFESIDLAELPALFASLSPEAAEAFVELPMIELVTAVQEDPEAARDIAMVMARIRPEGRHGYLASLAAARRRIGVRAADLYRYALAEPSIALDDELRGSMLLALIEEADEAGSALLQELRSKAPKKLRAPFQVALLKLETARASGGAKVAGGVVEAFASNPDGQGAMVVFVSFRNPDGSLTIANVCLRLADDLRNGFVDARLTRAERDRMIEGFSDDGSIVLVPAPPGEVARLVAEAADRTMKLRGELPGDVRRAVELIARIPAVEPPPAVPARSLSTSTLSTLFRRAEHQHWFFDEHDLDRYGAMSLLDAPSGIDRAALDALAASPMRPRVVAMARYMSRWASWRGDDGEAADWTTLAEGVERDFARSPLVTAMAVLTLNPDAFSAVAPPAPTLGRAAAGRSAPGGLEAFEVRFPGVAADELRTIAVQGDRAIPDDAYELHEFYCVDPGCDCNRVLLKAVACSTGREVATIGHGFDAGPGRFSMGLPRTYLDPLHPNAPFAGALLGVVERTLRTDAAWHRRLQDHYRMVKQAIAPAPVRRAGPKIGPNERCPCGSGKKYKKCCGGR